MNSSLDPAIVEAYALAPANVEIVETIELRHDALEEPMFLVSGRLNRILTADGVEQTFRASNFKLVLPSTDEGGLQEMTITIANVENRVVDFCEVAVRSNAPIQILYRPYRVDTPETPMMDPPLLLFLEDVTATDTEVSGRANPMDFLNLQFPNELYNRRDFPGLGD
jgi:hypothetical protein